MSKIDDILDEVSYDDLCPVDAKYQLLHLVLEVIGEDEQQGSVNIKAGELYALRNQLRSEQLQKAYELFGKEQL